MFCVFKQGDITITGKRGNGEGSIYHRESDGKWVGSVTLGNGKRRVFYGKTRKEVQEKLKAALHEEQLGTLVPASQQTVGQFLPDWLENTHKSHIRPRTFERYEEAIHLHIVPAPGNYKLQKLTARQVQAFYSSKLAEGSAPATVRYYHSVLHNALKTAVKWELVTRNVCDLVSPPRKERFEIHPLTVEQVQTFLKAMHGHKGEALFTLALATGMRRGELLGLKWQDINLTTGMLQVRRILTRIPSTLSEKKHVYVEAEPKTQKSRRSVTLPSFALESLQKHRLLQGETKLRADALWQEHDYVFCTLTGTHLNPNHVVEELKKILKQAGLPEIRFHDLRHSAATLLLSLGIHPKVVRELPGHTQISMTMDIYSHVLPGMQQDAMGKLNTIFKRTEHEGEEEK